MKSCVDVEEIKRLNQVVAYGHRYHSKSGGTGRVPFSPLEQSEFKFLCKLQTSNLHFLLT